MTNDEVSRELVRMARETPDHYVAALLCYVAGFTIVRDHGYPHHVTEAVDIMAPLSDRAKSELLVARTTN